MGMLPGTARVMNSKLPTEGFGGIQVVLQRKEEYTI